MRPNRSRRIWSVVPVVVVLSAALVACSGSTSDGNAQVTGSNPAKATVPGRTDDELVENAKLSQLPAFQDVPWADDLKAEQEAFGRMPGSSSRFGDYAMPDFSGEYTNVRDSERRTLDLSCACPKRTVWLFGASSAFGLGQRDDYTTASFLVSVGNEAGIDLDVRNLAVPGRTLDDEVGGLEARIRLEDQRPDVVIFMDGFNDALASYMYAVVRDGATLTPIRFEDAWADEFLEVRDPTLDDATVEKLAQHVADEYRAHIAEVEALLAPLGIVPVFFFQPDGFVSPLQSEGLAKSLNRTMSELSQDSAFSKLLRRTAELLDDAVVDLRTPMAAFDKPVFADTTHFNETGAEFIAGLIFERIKAELR